MTMHRLPDGWTQDELDALNELVAAAQAFLALRDVLTAAGVNTPTSQAILAAVRGSAVASYQRLAALINGTTP